MPKYNSPKIYLDPHLHDVFYEYRDPQTGAEEYTVPAQTSARAYQNTQEQTGSSQQTGFGADGHGGHDQGTNGQSVGQDAESNALAGVGASFAATAAPAPAAPAPAPVATPSVAPVSAPSSSSGSSTFA